MDWRLRTLWLGEADAIERRRIAELAYAVRIGFADKDGFKQAMDKLEIQRTRRQTAEGTWEMLKMIGKG